MKRTLRYDDTNMWSRAVGKGGATAVEWKRMLPRMKAARAAVQKISRTKEQGFLDLPFDRSAHTESVAMAKRVSKRFTDMVVLGIGGSDLGGRMLKETLEGDTRRKGMRVRFAGATTDPEALARLLAGLDYKKTCVNIVSKSGGTVEPMTSFYFLRERLKKAVGAKQMPGHVIATTDASGGRLRALAESEGYATLDVPRNVGGRYSVLSSVGLFPAAAMGVDTNALLSGARAAVGAFNERSAGESSVCRYAGLHVLGAETRKQKIPVTMPYSARMGEFGRWVRQLVAESLGKRVNRRAKIVHAGVTPFDAVGPEDQHSQLQLWSEGPADKLITFIEVNRFREDVVAPRHAGGGSMTKLIHLERQTTAEALRRVGRPNGTLFVDRLDARAVGELILFFQLATALMGELLDVNAYDQPGVELMKKLLRKSLEGSLNP